MQKILFAIFGAVILLMDTAFAAPVTPIYEGEYSDINKTIYTRAYNRFLNCVEDYSGTGVATDDCISVACQDFSGTDYENCLELVSSDYGEWQVCDAYYEWYKSEYGLGVEIDSITMCDGIKGYGVTVDPTLYGFCSDGREGYDVSTRSCVACASYQYQEFVENVEIDGVTNYPYFTGHKCLDCPTVYEKNPNGIVTIDGTKEGVGSCCIQQSQTISSHTGGNGAGTATFTQKCCYNAAAGAWPTLTYPNDED